MQHNGTFFPAWAKDSSICLKALYLDTLDLCRSQWPNGRVCIIHVECLQRIWWRTIKIGCLLSNLFAALSVFTICTIILELVIPVLWVIRRDQLSTTTYLILSASAGNPVSQQDVKWTGSALFRICFPFLNTSASFMLLNAP